MKNFTKKVIILLFVFIIGFTFIGCKKDNPSEENKEIVENYSLVLEVGSKKEIDISSTLEIEVDITNREIVSFSNNTFFALKEGSTTVTLKIKGTENLKQIYSIEVIKEKELNVSYEAEMKVGDKKSLSVKYDEKEVDNFEVFIEDNTILSYQNKEFTALKKGSTNVFITYNTGSKTLTKTISITVKEVAQGDDDLVITISGNIYANQNVSYTIKTKDGIDVTDYEVEVEDEDLVEFYPEDNEFTTLDEGTTIVTFKALIDGALYTKE
ncbi:MAG: hypothetical protein J5666_06335, partial [Bacilli bacterium]|nr:hypothetical protein [Bacilli bacterium]